MWACASAVEGPADALMTLPLHPQMQLLDIAKTEAHKKLFEGQYDLAIPAALQALRFSISVYGQHSVEVGPGYLLLGEASIGKCPCKTHL
jgi:hypothetical protein